MSSLSETYVDDNAFGHLVPVMRNGEGDWDYIHRRARCGDPIAIEDMRRELGNCAAGRCDDPGAERCTWPECREVAICRSGNFGDQLVCAAHFAITNGPANTQETVDAFRAACGASPLVHDVIGAACDYVDALGVYNSIAHIQVHLRRLALRDAVSAYMQSRLTPEATTEEFKRRLEPLRHQVGMRFADLLKGARPGPSPTPTTGDAASQNGKTVLGELHAIAELLIEIRDDARTIWQRQVGREAAP